jgi:hypothetical protein
VWWPCLRPRRWMRIVGSLTRSQASRFWDDQGVKMKKALVKDYGFVAVDQHAIFDVPAYGP